MTPPFGPQFRTYVGIVALGVMLLGLFGSIGVAYYVTPAYTRVGYAPLQPVSFSHKVHVGQLGMDCLHCHNHVGESPHANIPSTQTCLNCHGQQLGNIKSDSAALAPLREAQDTGRPLPWVRIHKVPDFAYFNHAVHVKRGVSCVSCHGQINEMEIVSHNQPLSMSWCLDCHRNPEPNLRPADKVTDLTWKPADVHEQNAFLKHMTEEVGIAPPTNCSACHR